MRPLFASLLLNFVIKFCFGEVSAFTIHPTGQPIACYYDETKIDTALLLYPNQHEFNVGFEIELISSTNNSLLINFNGSTFWMNIGYLAVNTRNYDNQTALLYQEPTFNSKIVYEFIKPQTLLIFGICDDWLFVKINTDNKCIFGWLPPNMQCGSPLTTCP